MADKTTSIKYSLVPHLHLLFILYIFLGKGGTDSELEFMDTQIPPFGIKLVKIYLMTFHV